MESAFWPGKAVEDSEAKVKTLVSTIITIAFVLLPLGTNAADSKETERLENCGTVMEEILNVPDNIPPKLLDKAKCVIVIPSVLKAAFGVGGAYGRGAMTCRGGAQFNGKWSAPAMIALEGGSFGFQLGAQATDFVILVMNPRGASAILGTKVKLGADASATAGPKGRDAEADSNVTLRAEMLTYSRSRGLFAGVSLEGSTLRPDNNANLAVYGRHISATAIVRKNVVQTPAAGQKLVSVLDKQLPRNASNH